LYFRNQKSYHYKNCAFLLPVFIICFVYPKVGTSQTSTLLGIRTPSFFRQVPVFESDDSNILSFLKSGNYYFKPTVFKRIVVLDTIGGYFVISESLGNRPAKTINVIPKDQYISMRIDNDVRQYWHNLIINRRRHGGSRDGVGGAIEITIPIKIESKAFQTIFGGNTVGLRVSGNVNIQGALRNENKEQVRTTIGEGSNISFNVKQTQQFTVEGKIGEKVSVFIDQDSERLFEFDNAVKLTYTGFEDEIIKKIEAGNIGLSLPGTNFVTFSGNNQGLFGLKALMQIGSINITTIASIERGEKNEIELTGGSQAENVPIKPNQYISSKYFYLDENYLEHFSDGLFTDRQTHIFNPEFEINEIRIFQSIPTGNLSSDEGAFQAWAIYMNEDNRTERADDNTVTDGDHVSRWFVEMLPEEYVLNSGSRSSSSLFELI